MKFHPLCTVFPELTPEEFKALVEDVRANGVLHPVYTYEGDIVDGRHRWLAAKEARKQCPIVELKLWPGQSLVDTVVSLNMRRRHLTTGQLAAAAVAIAEFKSEEARARQSHGRTAPGQRLASADAKRSASPEAGKATTLAAKMVGVSAASVERAKRVKAASPRAFKSLAAGKISVSAAHKQAVAPKAPPKPNPADTLDKLGRKCPSLAVAAIFDAAGEILDLTKAIDQLRAKVKEVAQRPIGRFVDTDLVERELKAAATALKRNAAPHAVCPYWPNCQKGSCKACRGAGWLPESLYNIVPEELRK